MKNVTYDGVQAMRGVAATTVVVYHTMEFWRRTTGTSTYVWTAGSAGVDLFFVISGFVMVLSTMGRPNGVSGARYFLKRRALRLLPMYWLVTALFALEYVLFLFYPQLKASGENYAHLSAKFVLTSLFMIPYDNHGYSLPLVGVGWTLCLEAFFYLLFALALVFRSKPAYFLTPVIVLLVLVHPFTVTLTFRSLTQPIMLEFLGGVWLATFLSRGYRLPMWLTYTLLAAGLVLLASPFSLEGSSTRVTHRALPAVAVIGALCFGEHHLRKLWPKFLLLLGDASYSIYLIHILVVSWLFRLYEGLGLANAGTTDVQKHVLTVAVAVVCAVAAGVVLYLKVELPLNELVRKRFLRSGRLQVTHPLP